MASKKKPSKKKSTSSRKSTREPQTMEELLAEAKTPISAFSKGQKVEGKVINISKKSVTFDIGGKSEGLVAERAFVEAKDFIKSLKVRDIVAATVLIPETPEGFTILSLREAARSASWQKVEKAAASGSPISVLGTGANPSGVTVEVAGLSGFIPNFQIGKEASKNISALVGKSFEAIPIELDRNTNKVVLSEKAVSEAHDIALAERALKKVKEGEVYEGVVTTVVDFGAFVRIEVALTKKEKVPVEGLVHISELSWEKVDEVKSVVSEGDKVKVKVIGSKAGRLALSVKQAKPDPWQEAKEKYKKDTKLEGKVVRISNFGTFVQLAPGVEGLIHITKIPPGEKLKEGQEVDVYVEDVDEKERRLSLGLVLKKKPVGYK